MVSKTIWLNEGKSYKKRQYWLFDVFSTRKEAVMMAKFQKKENKSKYFIWEYEHGTLFPHKRYALYLNNIRTL